MQIYGNRKKISDCQRFAQGKAEEVQPREFLRAMKILYTVYCILYTVYCYNDRYMLLYICAKL